MKNTLSIIGRQRSLFVNDLKNYSDKIDSIVNTSRFLVIGAGGSIGKAVCKEIFKRGALSLDAVDLSENYLVELVREIRSQYGYVTKDFDAHALDCGSEIFKNFCETKKYDYVLNLSALKHVRSENTAFTISRMFETNVLNTLKTYDLAVKMGAKKYFCVSTDKASNPVNVMGATKRAMELCLFTKNREIDISSARFANVAFSHGSLLDGFKNRLDNNEPLSVPSDISRFFITDTEAGQICLFSVLLGKDGEVYFPNNPKEIRLTNFITIAKNYLKVKGFKPHFCDSEESARRFFYQNTINKNEWPVHMFQSDTAGEKIYEEFHTDSETVNTGDFFELGAVMVKSPKTEKEIRDFIQRMNEIDLLAETAKIHQVRLLEEFVSTFKHATKNKNLNQRM